MMTRWSNPLVAVTLVSASLVIGCSAKSQVPPPEAKFDAELSVADRRAAAAQKRCPVSDERLGSMGSPIKVTVDGRHFFICCASCESDAEANFDEYFAKVEIKPASPSR